MKTKDLHARLKILELTAHFCVNKVDNRIQALEDAHREIREEWGKFFWDLEKNRKMGRS